MTRDEHREVVGEALSRIAAVCTEDAGRRHRQLSAECQVKLLSDLALIHAIMALSAPAGEYS